MPRFIKGELFNTTTDAKEIVYIVTTNSVLVKHWLVMGGGAARDMRDRYPGSPAWAFEAIRKHLGATVKLYDEPPIYGYLRIKTLENGNHLGIFQTKQDYVNPSTVNLIKISCAALAVDGVAHPQVEFRLNFPGIGLGGMDREEVLPLLSVLPDNVLVFEL